jgi:FkbM family methyltransferase
MLRPFVNHLVNQATILMLRPYISRELPGWGYLYQNLIGDYRAEERWKGTKRRWVRGKLHGYEMPLDLGLWSNRASFFLGRYYDLPTQLALMALLRPGDTFVDIGANQGMISLLASRLVGTSGKVVAFEPNPAPRAKFEATLARNAISNVVLHPVGLGDAAAVLELRVPRMNSGEGSFGVPDYNEADMETIPCQVLPGDELLGAVTPRLIKIDVEGYELHVLRGLEATLARARPFLITELISKHLANAGVRLETLTDFLGERGFKAFRLHLRSHGMKKSLALVPEKLEGEISGDFLWASVDTPLPPELVNEQAS